MRDVERKRLYARWFAMIQRCENPADKSYPNYGGRGIGVCARWHSFDLYLTDLAKLPGTGATLDRIDNDGSYGPSNVRWATYTTQTGNRRRRRDSRDECPHGHGYTPDNTRVGPRNSRHCRTCDRERVRRYRASKARTVRVVREVTLAGDPL